MAIGVKVMAEYYLNYTNLVIRLTSAETLPCVYQVCFVLYFLAHHLVITMSTSDDKICKMVLPLTSPPPVHQASCLLIRWHSLPCQKTF